MEACTWCSQVWRVIARVETVAGLGGTRNERVVLDTSCAEGTLLAVMDKAALQRAPDWSTLQVGEFDHAVFRGKALKLNHSSTPNIRIDLEGSAAIEFHSTRFIEAGEALTFNYNTTEWQMDEPFADWVTGETVQGFSMATLDEQRRLLQQKLAAPHIRDLAGRAAL
jgi:hypothetical protein